MKYFYPIVLKNKRLRPFNLCKGIIIRHMSITEREDFFGLEKAEFSFSNKFPAGFVAPSCLTPSGKKGRYHYKDLLPRSLFTGPFDIIASNYVICIEYETRPTPFDTLIDEINISFILHKPTSTGGYVYFGEDQTESVGFHYRMVIHGPFDYLFITKNDLRNIKKIFELVQTKKDDNKFNLCIKLYCRALQGGRLDFDLRFISLITCLESLYLPDREQELTFLLSLRIAKVLSRYGYGTCENIFNRMKDIYGVRSSLLHSGKTNKLDKNIFNDSVEIVRKSLNLYLNDPTLFSKNSLDKIVLSRN
jgi:hypothetical protein